MPPLLDETVQAVRGPASSSPCMPASLTASRAACSARQTFASPEDASGSRAGEARTRKPSSCPVLFSWDGERFAYVTDILGVGGLGFFVSPDRYAPPDPTHPHPAGLGE